MLINGLPDMRCNVKHACFKHEAAGVMLQPKRHTSHVSLKHAAAQGTETKRKHGSTWPESPVAT